VRWRAYRCIGVVTVTALALLGGLIVSLPRADVAGSLGVATVSDWRRTRPTVDRRDDERGDDDRRATSRRRSRYADLVVTSPEPQ
jgi:hypothetical protein